MSSPRPPRGPGFAPRATLVLLGGVALFFAVSLLYSLPVLLDPPPDGAPDDYAAQRVREHLHGKTFYFFAGSLFAVAIVASRIGRK
ncbi:MAG TPA: hypothetical protein VMR31_17100 [Myxococcota bacterium]|nr:hypothetical protein [Myxococcota bacterium]